MPNNSRGVIESWVSYARGWAGWCVTSAARSKAKNISKRYSPPPHSGGPTRFAPSVSASAAGSSIPSTLPRSSASARARQNAPYGVKVSIVSTNALAPGGQFVLHAKSLSGNPYDGHTLKTVVKDTQQLTGREIERKRCLWPTF